MAIQPVEQGSAFAFRNIINNNFYELKVLSGASKPTQSTAAVVGQMYLDTSEGKMYFCSNVSGSIYTWKPFASDMSASNVSYNNGSSGMSSDNVQDAIDELFTSASNGKELIADAIAGKGVPTSANDTYATMAGNIEKIETGIDISDATLTSASELKKDIIAHTKTGQRIVGGLGQGTVNKPSISVSTAGKITASTSYTGGIIGSSTVSNTYQLSTQAGTTITPGASRKTAVSVGKYTTGTVYVDGDSNLVPGNIIEGVNIFGVFGEAKNIIVLNNVITGIKITRDERILQLTAPSVNSYFFYGAVPIAVQCTSTTGAGVFSACISEDIPTNLNDRVKAGGFGLIFDQQNQANYMSWDENTLSLQIECYMHWDTTEQTMDQAEIDSSTIVLYNYGGYEG